MVRGIELAHATGVMGAKRKWTGVDVVDLVDEVVLVSSLRLLPPAVAAHAIHALREAAVF
jgi:hypothetical protein